MEEIEETHRMIQQMEELVALTPGDPELLQTLSDLYDLLNIQLVQANTNQPSEDEEQQQGELFEEMLSPGSNVIYKSQQENEEVWKPGQVIKQTDGAKGRQWEVSTLEGVIITVDLQNIRPSQYHNQVVTKAEHSDNESVTETSSMNEEELDDQFDIVPKHWGGWEAHSTGFASRMMSKMGYVPVR